MNKIRPRSMPKIFHISINKLTSFATQNIVAVWLCYLNVSTSVISFFLITELKCHCLLFTTTVMWRESQQETSKHTCSPLYLAKVKYMIVYPPNWYSWYIKKRIIQWTCSHSKVIVLIDGPLDELSKTATKPLRRVCE